MPYTFLQAVNNSLKRVGIIQGQSGNLTSFTDSGRQTDIDVMIACWNEAMQDLADQPVMVPGLSDQGNLTLATGNREYGLPTGNNTGKQIELVKQINNKTLRYPLKEYPGGYQKMLYDQPDPTLFQGPVIQWCINPGSGKIRFDFTPVASVNGQLLTVDGTIRISLSLISDQFPFTDTVVDQLVKPVAMAWARERKKGDWSRDAYMQGLSDAMRYVTAIQPRQSYGVRRK